MGTYCALSLVSLDLDEGIVIFTDVQAEEMGRRKVFAAFEAAVGVLVAVVRFVFLVGREGDWFFVRWEGAGHRIVGLGGDEGRIQLGDFGCWHLGGCRIWFGSSGDFG